MTDKQHPAQFDWATELSDAEGHVTLSAKEAHEIGARLRSMGEKLKTYEDLDEAASDVQLLRMGYAAARLALVQYGAHDGACSVGDLDDEGRHCACDCGYESAIKAAEDKALNA